MWFIDWFSIYHSGSSCDLNECYKLFPEYPTLQPTFVFIARSRTNCLYSNFASVCFNRPIAVEDSGNQCASCGKPMSNGENIGKLNSVIIDPHRGKEELSTCCAQPRHLAIFPHFELKNSDMNSSVIVNKRTYALCLVDVVELLSNVKEARNAMRVSGISSIMSLSAKISTGANLPAENCIIAQHSDAQMRNISI